MLGVNLPNPTDMVTGLADEKQKHAIIAVGAGVSYSMVLSGLYTFGECLSKRKHLGWLGSIPMMMSGVAYVLLTKQKEMKHLIIAAPKALVEDQELLDKIYLKDSVEGDLRK
jgi:hypothetical protein